MTLFIVKITTKENVDKIINKQPFTHQGIYLFKDSLVDGAEVAIVFGGDKAQISWKQGLIGIGKVIKCPYDQGYETGKPRNFKIDIQPISILDEPLAPKLTKLHSKYRHELYEAPYIGANHVPTQAIAKADGDAAKAVFNLVHDALPLNQKTQISKDKLLTKALNLDLLSSNLNISKPFILLSGISGTGKTRFVREQAINIDETYELVSVRPDWHEPSDLLGYISRLSGDAVYITTDVLKFLVKAWIEIERSGVTLHDDKVEGNQHQQQNVRPFWLCLDEMNLAPVEQYFADYLSVLETREWNWDNDAFEYKCDPLLKASVFEGVDKTKFKEELGLTDHDVLWEHFVKNGISIPFNLIVAGTVNMDETTHGFSRKVIDRALTFDFGEFFPNDFDSFFNPKTEPKLLGYPTWTDGRNIDELSNTFDVDGKLTIEFLSRINDVLDNTPFKLAYRALNELLLSVIVNRPDTEEALQAVWDDFLMSKVLPRIEGDIDKLTKGDSDIIQQLEELLQKQLVGVWEGELRPDFYRKSLENDDVIKIPCRSKAKLEWMNDQLNNGFTSFWP